jgi:ankyrin repeat protein
MQFTSINVRFLLAATIILAATSHQALATPPTPGANSQLVDAAAKGDTPTVQALLKAGAKPNEPGKDCRVPIVEAARYGHVATVVALLDAGGDVNAKFFVNCWDVGPLSAVSEAVRAKRTNVLRPLLKAGGKGSGGRSPLAEAIDMGYREVFDEMIGVGVNVNDASDDGATVLMFAVESNDGDAFVGPLLALGADPNAKDKFGETSLHRAARAAKHPVAVRMLLEAKANPALQNSAGITAESIARERLGRAQPGTREHNNLKEIVDILAKATQ